MKKLSIFLLALVTGVGTMQADIFDGNCGDNLTWSLNTQDSTLTIEGSGAMTNWSESSLVPWNEHRSYIKYINLPDGLTSLGESAFISCPSLTSIEIPNSVTVINEYTFWGCSSIVSVTIGSGVTSIRHEAFLSPVLTSIVVSEDNQFYSSTDGILFDKNKTILVQYPAGRVGPYTIPNTVTSIGNLALNACEKLTSISIPNSVTSIGGLSFHGCSSLTSIEIPNSVTSIGQEAFCECSGLTSVTIPNSVTSIGSAPFYRCRNLTSITVSADNPNYISEDGVLFDKGKKTLIQYPVGNTRSSYIIPNTVTSIGSNAFYYCNSLTSITIPNSVTSIGGYAFGNPNLTSIICEAINPPTLDGSFNHIDKSIPLYVPVGSVDAYQAADQWKDFENIIGIESQESVVYSGTCGDNLTWSLNTQDSTLTIEGSGAMTNWSESSFVPWNEHHSCIKYINLPDGLTSLGENAFFDCSNLTSVVIPNNAISIGRFAFGRCGGLTTIEIPNSVTSIEELAFWGCGNITSITIGSGVTSIGNRAFESQALTSFVVAEDNQFFSSADGVLFDKNKTIIMQYPAGRVGPYTIPNTVTSIGGSAFSGCTGLTSITIPNSVIGIGVHAFYACENLTSLTIPSSVTSIGDGAFFQCGNLTSIIVDEDNQSYSSAEGVLFNKSKTVFIQYPANKESKLYEIPNGVTTIRGFALGYYPSIDTISIPSSVTTIEEGTFFYCRYLKSIINYSVIPQTLTSEVFWDIDKSIPLYVPAGSVDAYQAADQWKDFTNILALPETEEVNCNIRYVDKDAAFVSSEQLTFNVPEAPEFDGFTFLRWEFVGGPMSDGLTIQAVYQADPTTSAPTVVTNPANPAQKLIREGNVYILQGDKTYTITGQPVR